MKDFIRIHSADTVAVALKPLAAGETYEVGNRSVTLREDIPQGHKFALDLIPAGQTVIKYGCSIGELTFCIIAPFLQELGLRRIFLLEWGMYH